MRKWRNFCRLEIFPCSAISVARLCHFHSAQPYLYPKFNRKFPTVDNFIKNFLFLRVNKRKIIYDDNLRWKKKSSTNWIVSKIRIKHFIFLGNFSLVQFKVSMKNAAIWSFIFQQFLTFFIRSFRVFFCKSE